MTFQVTDILALIESPDNVGDNWRILRPFIRLRQTGVNARYYWGGDDTTVATDPEQTILVARMLSATDHCTVDRWIAQRRTSVRAIIYETDDVFYGQAMIDHLEAADFMRGKTREEVIAEGELAAYFAAQCDGIVVSSEPLAAMIRPDFDVPVAVVPNAIDVRWFRSQMAYRAPWADHLTIGWCGGRRPEADIAPMAEAWGRIAYRYPAVRFVVAAPELPRVILDAVPTDRLITFPWVSYGDSPVLYQTDIGCAAVADTPFSRCKTAIKCWEYALAGAAVVATPTLYGGCVDNGRGGMLATTAEEWEDALAFFLEDANRRRMWNRALVAHVERHHSLDTQLPRWTSGYASIVDAASAVLA